MSLRSGEMWRFVAPASRRRFFQTLNVAKKQAPQGPVWTYDLRQIEGAVNLLGPNSRTHL
jgi:hypothetical protein